MSLVIDASALLAVLLDETGADFVMTDLRRSIMSVVNLSEGMSRAIDQGHRAASVEALVARFEILPVAFSMANARLAADLRTQTRHLGLSLGDRACLALAIERGFPIITGDRRLASFRCDVPIRMIR